MNEKEMISTINALQFLDFNKMDMKDRALIILALSDFSEKVKPIILKYGIKEFMEQKP